MASGFLTIMQSTVIMFDLLLDQNTITTDGGTTKTLPDLSDYNCLALYVGDGTTHQWYYLPYLPTVPSSQHIWQIACYGDGGTNAGCRAITVNWANNTISTSQCNYNGSWSNGYGLIKYVYGLRGDRLTL